MDDGEISNVNETTVWRMLLLRYGAFLQTVQHVCAVWGRKLVEPTEDYLTIACPCCSNIAVIGASKVFRCAHALRLCERA